MVGGCAVLKTGAITRWLGTSRMAHSVSSERVILYSDKMVTGRTEEAFILCTGRGSAQ
jgi:hypothetical protein